MYRLLVLSFFLIVGFAIPAFWQTTRPSLYPGKYLVLQASIKTYLLLIGDSDLTVITDINAPEYLEVYGTYFLSKNFSVKGASPFKNFSSYTLQNSQCEGDELQIFHRAENGSILASGTAYCQIANSYMSYTLFVSNNGTTNLTITARPDLDPVSINIKWEFGKNQSVSAPLQFTNPLIQNLNYAVTFPGLPFVPHLPVGTIVNATVTFTLTDLNTGESKTQLVEFSDSGLEYVLGSYWTSAHAHRVCDGSTLYIYGSFSNWYDWITGVDLYDSGAPTLGTVFVRCAISDGPNVSVLQCKLPNLKPLKRGHTIQVADVYHIQATPGASFTTIGKYCSETEYWYINILPWLGIALGTLAIFAIVAAAVTIIVRRRMADPERAALVNGSGA